MDINDVTYTGNPDVVRSREAFWFDDGKGKGLIDDIWAERRRQIESGYTHEHDDEHGVGHLVGWAAAYARTAMQSAVERESPAAQRQLLVQAAALLVAAIETMDREESSDGEH